MCIRDSAFTVKEQWTSTAIIVAPRSTDLGHLLPTRAEYARIIGDGNFSTGGLSSSLYGQFKHFLLSNDLKRKFLEQSEWLKNYTKNMTEEQKHAYIENAVDKYLIVHEVDPKKKDLTELDKIGLKVTFSAETPKDAQSVLTEYVSFVNKYILNQINQEFKLEFNLRLDALKFTKEQITFLKSFNGEKTHKELAELFKIKYKIDSVSYTHLTLPTKRIV